MGSLREMQNGIIEIPIEDQIFYNKFEDFFENIHNGKTVINFKCKREETAESMIALIEEVNSFPGKKVILTTNGDTDFPCIKKEFLLQDNIPYTNELQQSLENTKLEDFINFDMFKGLKQDTKIFCHSVIKKKSQLKMIPLGRDPKGKFVLDKFRFEKSVKNNLCYYNCSIPPMTIHWYGRIRSYIHDGLNELNFVTIENVNLNSSRDLSEASFVNYYENISKSKFMICPRGCGLDTYRLWDCLYLGCIPIVVKYEGYADFEDLPILFVDKWEDYLNLNTEYLEKKYLDMLDSDYNYQKLKFSWWNKIIQSEIDDI